MYASLEVISSQCIPCLNLVLSVVQNILAIQCNPMLQSGGAKWQGAHCLAATNCKRSTFSPLSLSLSPLPPSPSLPPSLSLSNSVAFVLPLNNWLIAKEIGKQMELETILRKRRADFWVSLLTGNYTSKTHLLLQRSPLPKSPKQMASFPENSVLSFYIESWLSL